MHEWLGIAAKHVSFNECVGAASKVLACGHYLASFGCTKCGALHLDAGDFARKLHTRHVCQVCEHHWIKQPPVIGNPLAVLCCWLVGATVHVGWVPVAAGTPQEGPAHVGCMSSCCRTAHTAGSCVEATVADRQSVALKPAQGLCSDSAHGMPCGTRVAHVLSLEVELMFLAHVVEAIWANTDVEM